MWGSLATPRLLATARPTAYPKKAKKADMRDRQRRRRNAPAPRRVLSWKNIQLMLQKKRLISVGKADRAQVSSATTHGKPWKRLGGKASSRGRRARKTSQMLKRKGRVKAGSFQR
jgi:hypothetical protein